LIPGVLALRHGPLLVIPHATARLPYFFLLLGIASILFGLKDALLSAHTGGMSQLIIGFGLCYVCFKNTKLKLEANFNSGQLSVFSGSPMFGIKSTNELLFKDIQTIARKKWGYAY